MNARHPRRVGRLITCDADVAEGAAWLAARDPKLAQALAQTQEHIGPLPLRLRPDGFGAVINAIISQQVSVASAAAVQARMETAGLLDAQGVAQASEDTLRAAGLSRQKIRYVQALAAADIDFIALREMPDAQVLKTLTAVSGIGSWTAQIYAMFSLGRADVFPQGDLALQESARVLFGLPDRPKPRALAMMAQDWAPWRSVAARLLFAYYRVVKQREGIT